MSSYFKEGTDRTPQIKIDQDSGRIEIIGRSMPENIDGFFKEFQQHLLDFVANPPSKIDVVMDLEYFNTATSKTLLDLIKSLHDLKSGGREVCVEWHFEEDDWDMSETGNDFVSLYGDLIKLCPK